MNKIIFALLLISFNAVAFIPPVSSVLKEIFDSRKFAEGVEIVFNHQVLSPNGEWSEIEERILADNRGIKFLWKPAGSGLLVSGQLDKRVYSIGSDKKVNARSLLFLKNFTAASSIEFRDALINERFLKWEQMKQFKEGFELQGEPQSWDIKSNYLQQDSVSLVLLPSGPTIALVGYQDPTSKKTIYFDKGLAGVKKIEWIEGSENLSWSFDQFSIGLKDSYFPRKSALAKDGRDIIQSEVVALKSLNKRQAADWYQLWQKANKSLASAPTSEESLRSLLSFR
jgi:hypothetical protein